jgi:hypothetical protein
MPSSEKSNRVFATTASSRSKPIPANTGAAELGLALCATTQTEQEADSLALG